MTMSRLLSAAGAFCIGLSAPGATYTVDRLSDNNPAGGGEGSASAGDLRYCISQSNATSARDTISFNRGLVGTINLAAALPNLINTLTIRGPGANRVTVKGNGGNVITIDSGAKITILGVTITGGLSNGGGVFINGGGTLTLNNVAVSGNTSSAGGVGGGIWNYVGGMLTLNSCTISGNTAVPNQYGLGFGGGVTNYGTLTGVNSTFSGNDANFGGAIYNTGTVTLNNSTFSDNSATSSGGGINNAGTIQTRNTIIAGNAGGDVIGNLGSLGHNLIGVSAGGSGYDASDLLDVDPLLGPLQNNGGPTVTHALSTGSPAIDAGDNTSAPQWDQRGKGFSRVVNGTIDIGAFEVQ